MKKNELTDIRNLRKIEEMQDHEIIEEREVLAKEYQFLSRRATLIANRLNKVRHILRIRRLNRENKPLISDHALLRYMQRVQGIDTEGLRDQLQERMPKIGKGKNWKEVGSLKENGITYYLSDDKRCVTTIMKDEG